MHSVENDCGEKDFVVLSCGKSLKDLDKDKNEKGFEKQVSMKTIDSTGKEKDKPEPWCKLI